MDVAALQFVFTTTYGALQRNLEGVTHEESLRRYPPNGSSLNWVVGHLAATRNSILDLLGEEPAVPPAHARPYRRGGPHGDDVRDAISLDQIRAYLARSQERIMAALARLTPAALDAPAGKSTVRQRLAMLQFHESYHVGQTAVFRGLLGKPGVV
jgi:hypothetical protein